MYYNILNNIYNYYIGIYLYIVVSTYIIDWIHQNDLWPISSFNKKKNVLRFILQVSRYKYYKSCSPTNLQMASLVLFFQLIIHTIILSVIVLKLIKLGLTWDFEISICLKRLLKFHNYLKIFNRNYFIIIIIRMLDKTKYYNLKFITSCYIIHKTWFYEYIS